MNASDLYIINRGSTSVLAVPDSDNVPTLLEPQPLVFRAEYLTRDFSETQLINARNALTAVRFLFVPVTCPDGPPYRSGVIFTFQREFSGPWKDHKLSPYHGYKMAHYKATTSYLRWEWIDHAESGRPGYFLTGHSSESTLWRVFRVEMDVFGRTVITVAPVQFAPDCPNATFASISDPLLRLELQGQYQELCERIRQNGYRDIATKSRNIVEALVAEKLRSQGHSATGELGKDLWKIKALLEDASKRASCGWTDIEYVLSNKIRLVHAMTHPERAAEGQPIRPEFAMGLVADFTELLIRWGYSKSIS